MGCMYAHKKVTLIIKPFLREGNAIMTRKLRNYSTTDFGALTRIFFGISKIASFSERWRQLSSYAFSRRSDNAYVRKHKKRQLRFQKVLCRLWVNYVLFGLPHWSRNVRPIGWHFWISGFLSWNRIHFISQKFNFEKKILCVIYRDLWSLHQILTRTARNILAVLH